MNVNVLIPLIAKDAKILTYIPILKRYAAEHKIYCHLILLNGTGIDLKGITPTHDQYFDISILKCPVQLDLQAAIKKGLYAAKADTVIILERFGPSIEEVFAQVNSKAQVVHGISSQYTVPLIFKRWVQSLLGKVTTVEPCFYKIITQQSLGPLLGRIYANNKVFDLEWGYLITKLNYHLVIHRYDLPIERPIRLDLMMYWNALKLRIWHYPQINLTEEHMSDAEMQRMYEDEQRHWWFITKGRFLRRLLSLSTKNGNILDAGCGTGHNMRSLIDRMYVGCDISAQALMFCQRNGHERLVQGHLQQLPFKPQSFDVVLSADVVEHTQNPVEVVNQLRRVLKSNGKLILTVPAFRFLFGPHDEALSHFRRYTINDVRQLLNEGGFDIERVGYLYCFPFIPVAIIRLVRKLLAYDAKPQSDFFGQSAKRGGWLIQLILKIEVSLLGKMPLPFGTSIYAVAKPKDKAEATCV